MQKIIYRLYTDIGAKIKSLAILLFIIGTVLSVIMGALLLIDALFLDGDMFGGELWWLGLITIVFGPILSLLFTWLLYGYGELIDKTCANARISARNHIFHLLENELSEKEYNRVIWRLYDDCLITYNEYKSAIEAKENK